MEHLGHTGLGHVPSICTPPQAPGGLPSRTPSTPYFLCLPFFAFLAAGLAAASSARSFSAAARSAAASWACRLSITRSEGVGALDKADAAQATAGAGHCVRPPPLPRTVEREPMTRSTARLSSSARVGAAQVTTGAGEFNSGSRRCVGHDGRWNN